MKTLEPPRWRNGPSICPVANLPAFESKEVLEQFRETNCPGGFVIAQWQCTACGYFHFWGGGFDPAGASSGTTRAQKYAEAIKARFLKSSAAMTIPKIKLQNEPNT